MSDPTTELLSAFVSATEERKALALKALKGEIADPVAAKPVTGPLLLSVGQGAELLGISRATIWRMICAGRIEKVEIYPGAYRLRRSDVEAIADGKRQAVPPSTPLRAGSVQLADGTVPNDPKAITPIGKHQESREGKPNKTNKAASAARSPQ